MKLKYFLLTFCLFVSIDIYAQNKPVVLPQKKQVEKKQVEKKSTVANKTTETKAAATKTVVVNKPKNETLNKNPRAIFLIKRAKVDSDISEPVLYPYERQLSNIYFDVPAGDLKSD